MLKISTLSSAAAITLKLEGRVVGPWVDELRAVCERYFQQCRHVELDLGEMTFADERGFAELVRLQLLGVRLRRCSPFVAEQLRPR